MERVYLDSCLIIYLVERHPLNFAPLHASIAAHPGATFCVSALTRLEVLAGPMRKHDDALVRRYETFLKAHQWLPIDDAIVSAALGWRVSGLKTPDALHVAVARLHGCAAFWTNDDRLSKVVPGWSRNLLKPA